MPRKPQQARAKATVAAIVDAGFLCVVEHGTEGTTTHHIARRAGVSVGTLYEYFADKHAIFDAMNDRISADVTELLASLTPELAREDVRTALRRLLDAFRELLERNDGRYLAYARHAMLSHARVHTAPIEKALLDLSVQFVMRQPTAAKLRNVPAMSYIFVNSGIFTMIRCNAFRWVSVQSNCWKHGWSMKRYQWYRTVDPSASTVSNGPAFGPGDAHDPFKGSAEYGSGFGRGPGKTCSTRPVSAGTSASVMRARVSTSSRK